MPQVYSFGIVLLELVTSQIVDDKIHKRILKATKMGTEPQGLKECLDSAGGPWPEDVEVRPHPTADGIYRFVTLNLDLVYCRDYLAHPTIQSPD